MGHNNPPAGGFEDDNLAAAGSHDMRRSARAAAMLDILFHLALHAEDEMLQVRAAERWLDIVEGPPKDKIIE